MTRQKLLEAKAEHAGQVVRIKVTTAEQRCQAKDLTSKVQNPRRRRGRKSAHWMVVAWPEGGVDHYVYGEIVKVTGWWLSVWLGHVSNVLVQNDSVTLYRLQMNTVLSVDPI